MRVPLLPGFSRPLLFAHRGLSARFPENTFSAFKAAIAAGIPGIELDVHLSSDGELVVFHDDTTERICPAQAGGPGAMDGSGDASGSCAASGSALRLETSTFAELAALDIGRWKGPEFSGERMPRLSEVFAEFGSSVYFDVEIKCRTARDTGIERALAREIVRAGMMGRCLVSSFNPFSLRRIKLLEPGLPVALIWSRSAELHWFLRHGEGRLVVPCDALKPEGILVGQAGSGLGLGGSERSLPILPWTVDRKSEADRLLALGAVGVISNRPDELGILPG